MSPLTIKEPRKGINPLPISLNEIKRFPFPKKIKMINRINATSVIGKTQLKG
ncbi:hypothetical protein D3C72_2545290 [compost metagenome]